MLSIRRVEGPDWAFWVATVKELEDENCDEYFIEDHQQVMANVMKIRDLLIWFLNGSKGYYDFDRRLMIKIIENFENADWGNKDVVDGFVWMTLSSVPDLLQND